MYPGYPLPSLAWHAFFLLGEGLDQVIHQGTRNNQATALLSEKTIPSGRFATEHFAGRPYPIRITSYSIPSLKAPFLLQLCSFLVPCFVAYLGLECKKKHGSIVPRTRLLQRSVVDKAVDQHV